jgi:hypothetical protein
MGVERAVTRWHALHQVLSEEIERLEAAQPPIAQQDDAEASEVEAHNKQLAEARERLRLLGPCPKPMMG